MTTCRISGIWCSLILAAVACVNADLDSDHAALDADANAKLQQLCAATGLCFASGPPPVIPPASPPAIPPAAPPPVLPPTPTPALVSPPTPAPAPVLPPAPAPATGCSIPLVSACGTACGSINQPYIGAGCPSGSFCTAVADSIVRSGLLPGQGLLAILGQATNLIDPVNCTSNADCGAAQFCAANSDSTTVCLGVSVPIGACLQGASAQQRVPDLSLAVTPTVGIAPSDLPPPVIVRPDDAVTPSP